MRAIALLSLIALFCLPVAANQDDEGVLPFAYVTWNGDDNLTTGDYDLYVMNAANGEIIREFVTEFHDCGQVLSANPLRILYSLSQEQSNIVGTFQLFVEDNPPVVISQYRLRDFAMNSELNRLAYYDSRYLNFSMYILDDNEWFRLPMEEILFGNRFVGDNLVFISKDGDDLILNNWNGLENERHILGGEGRQHVVWAEISPNGEFLVLNSGSISMIDLNDERSLRLSDVRLFGQWLPESEASFAYYNRDGGISILDLVSNRSREVLTEDPSAGYSILNWSPDGNFLLVSQYIAGGGELGSIAVFLVNVATGEIIHPSIQSYTLNWTIHWVSDSQFVYAYRAIEDLEGYFDIYLYDAISGEKRQLTNTPDIDEFLICAAG